MLPLLVDLRITQKPSIVTLLAVYLTEKVRKSYIHQELLKSRMAPNKKKFLRSLTFDLIPIKPHLTHGTKVWSANPKMENPQIHFSRSHRSTRLVQWCTG